MPETAKDEYAEPDTAVAVLRRMRDKIWNTRNARFAASRRLSAVSRASMFSLSVSSLMIALVPLAPSILPPGVLPNTLVSAVCLLAGLIIFSLGLLDNLGSRDVIGERLYVCAVNLNRLYDESLTWQEDVPVVARRVCDEYHRIIGECAGNHEFVDDEYARSKGILAAIGGGVSTVRSVSAFFALVAQLRRELTVGWRWHVAPVLPFYLLSLCVPVLLYLWVAG